MMNSSSCMKRYENYQTATHHSPSLSYNYSNNFPLQQNSTETTFNYSNANDWTGFPLIKLADSSPFRRISNNSFHESRNNFNNNKSVRKVNHTSSKPTFGCQNSEKNPFNDENIQIDKIENFITQKSCDNGEVHIALNHGNGTFLPRIIKPRKRRKKDRKPTNNLQQTVENASSTFPFTFSSTINETTMQNLSNNNSVDCVNENNNYNDSNNNYSQNSRNSKATKCDANVYFNNNTIFNSNLLASNIASSSISSSPISLSNSSLSSSNNSSCSCRLCDPNCKIWSFPLRRSFSDNSSSKMESKDSCDIEKIFNQKSTIKDVGVIGSNRSKSEGKSCTKSLLTLMDIIESEQNQQNLPNSMNQFINNPNLNLLDSSACNLVLNNLKISDNFLSSTINAVNEDFSNNELNIITHQLSGFNLIDDNHTNPNITEQNNRIISNNTSASLVKFENFIETPLKKQDHQSNFFSQNLFAHNLMKSEESNILGTNHNSFNSFDSGLNCDELLYSNLLNNNESNFPSQVKNGIENLSLFI